MTPAMAPECRTVGDRPSSALDGWEGHVRARLLQDWLCATPPGISTTKAGVSLFTRCVDAFAAMARSAQPRQSQPLRSDGMALRARPITQAPAAWSGFIRVAEDWLSIALADEDERAMALRCLRVHGAVRSGLEDLRACPVSATSLAEALQEWGIASLPASAQSNTLPRAQVTTSQLGEIVASSLASPQALAGLRVVDVGQLVSAPWAGALLAAHGACVIPVAHSMRAGNRRYGAEPMLLDLGDKHDRRRFAELCRGADLVLDNFRPRVWANFGTDPLELGARRHLTLPAFPAGDERNRLRCYGFQLEAFHGVGHAPEENMSGMVASPAQALLDHSVGFAGATLAIESVLHGTSGRLEMSHMSLAAQREGNSP